MAKFEIIFYPERHYASVVLEADSAEEARFIFGEIAYGDLKEVYAYETAYDPDEFVIYSMSEVSEDVEADFTEEDCR